MAAFNKFNDFAEQLGLGKHNLNTDTLKVMLTNTAPVATNTVFANITEITAQNGYTAGGEDTQNTYSETSGTGSCVGVDVVWTATGAGFGPFRYVVLYNDTQTSPAKPLIGWWDYGSSISLTTAGETFTTDFGASMFTIA
jgi:hypothetical protein